MKKTYLIVLALIMGVFLCVNSCKKQDVPVLPTVGKMQLPATNLVPGSEMVTKSGGITITTVEYSFYAQKAGVWVLCDNSFYKDGSIAQGRNTPVWSTAYCPSNNCQDWIEIPLDLPLKIVMRGLDEVGQCKYYGIISKTFPSTTPNISQQTVNMYEINSRLSFNVADLLLNTNYQFTFNFTFTTESVDFNNIKQTTSWLENAAANSRGWNMIPLITAGTPVTHTLVVCGTPQSVKLDGVTVPVVGGKYLLFELIEKGTPNFTTTYSILRLSDNYAQVTNQAVSVITGTGTPSGFPILNWLNPGYNFTITVTADPLKLGQGTFCGTLTNNTNVDGTLGL